MRLALLARHGGVWMDVSIHTCASVEDLGWAAIESGAKDAAAVFHPESAGRGLASDGLASSAAPLGWMFLAGVKRLRCFRAFYNKLRRSVL